MTAAHQDVPDHGNLLRHLQDRPQDPYSAGLLGLLFTPAGLALLQSTLMHGADGIFEEQISRWNSLHVKHSAGTVTLRSDHGQASGDLSAVLAVLREGAPAAEQPVTAALPVVTLPAGTETLTLPAGTETLTLPAGTETLTPEDRALLAAFALSSANVQFIRPGLLLGGKYDACYWQTATLHRLPRGAGTARALLTASP